MADNLTIHDITSDNKGFWNIENHGSNIAIINNQIFVTWFHGGERTATYSEIYCSNTNTNDVSWINPIIIADNGGNQTIPNQPDINPSFFYNSESNQIQLFWMKINDGTWESAEIRTRMGNIPNNFDNANNINWQTDISGNLINPIYQDEFISNTSKHFESTWPLYNGNFNSKESYKNSPALGSCDCTCSSYLELSDNNIDEMKSALIALISNFTNEYLKQTKQNISQAYPQYNSMLNILYMFSDIANVCQQGESSLHFNLNDILSFLYTTYDSFILIKMQYTTFNKKNANRYQKGWETRTQPIEINLPNNAKRLLLPVYSDGLGFSLVLYSDNAGVSWDYADTPITSRAGIQPSIVQHPTDGRIFAFMRNNGGILNLDKILLSTSCDYGLNWSPAVPVLSPELTNHSSSLSVILLKNSKYNTNGHIPFLLVYNPTDSRTKLNICVGTYLGNTLNENSLINWQKPITLEHSTDGTTYAYPSAVEDNDGSIYISFSHIYPSSDCGGNTCQKIGIIKYDGLKKV